MAVQNITQKTTSETLANDAHVLITQTENSVNSLRRIAVDDFMAAAIQPHIDSRLESNEKAAQAKAVGDAITEVVKVAEKDISALDKGSIMEAVFFEQGNLVEGVESDSKYRLRTGYFTTSEYIGMSVNRSQRTWSTYVQYFNSEHVFQVSSGKLTSDSYTFDQSAGVYFRIMVVDNTSGSWSNQIQPLDGTADYGLVKVSEIDEAFRACKAIAYIGDGMPFTYNRSGNTVTLDFSGKGINIRVGNRSNSVVNIPFSDVLSQMPDTWTSTGDDGDGNPTGIICPSYGCGLYYKLDAKELYFTSGYTHPKQKNYICLFESWYSSFASGLLVDYQVERQVKKVFPGEISDNAANIATNTENISANAGNIEALSKGVKVIAYLGNGAAFTYRRSGSTYIVDTAGANILLRMNSSSATTISFTDFCTAAEAAGWTATETGVVCPRAACAIYYNISTGALIFSTSAYKHDVSPETICLFEGHYNSVASGLLVDYYNYKTAYSLDQTIEDHINASASSIPDYYMEHLEAKIPTILANMQTAGKHGETFIFITDIHWEGNRKYSPALVKYLMTKFSINTLICGGDLINQGERTKMENAMLGCISSFNLGKPFPVAFGNHDDNWNNYGDQREHPEWKFSDDAVYAMMQKQAEDYVTYISDSDFDFYFDRAATKTRFIFLDTHNDFTFTNYGTLANCLLSIPAGWHAVIVAHAYYVHSSVLEYATNIGNMVDAYNAKATATISGTTYDFAAAAAEVVLMIGGHKHLDLDWTTTAGIPVVLTDCDAGNRSLTTGDQAYVKGTVTEQAFDVVTMDYTNKTIKCVRIGRGANRTFSYDS